MRENEPLVTPPPFWVKAFHDSSQSADKDPSFLASPSLTNVAVVLQAVADVLVDDRAELVAGAVLAAAAAAVLVVTVVLSAPGQDVARPGHDLVRARRLLPHRCHRRRRRSRGRLIFGIRRRWQMRGWRRARRPRPVLTALLFFGVAELDLTLD